MNELSQESRESGLEQQTWRRGLSMVDVVKGLWRHRWSSAIIVTAITALAAVVAFASTPLYRAEVLLSPLQEETPAAGGLSGIVRQLGDIAPLMGVGLGSVGLKEETMALVKSRSFLIEFIRDEKLMPILYPDITHAKPKGGEDLPTYGDGYKRFEKSVLSIREEKDSGLITLAIEWSDPQIAASWANKLVARINEHMRARAISEAQRSVEYLQKELTKTSILGIQDSIYRLIESHISQIALANARDGYAFRVIDAAVAPEAKDFVKPRRLLLLAFGLVGGSLLAVFIVLLRITWQRSQ